MKHVIDIPDEVEQALEQRALATGEDVADLIQMAVVSFVGGDVRTSRAGRRPDPPLPAAGIAPPAICRGRFPGRSPFKSRPGGGPIPLRTLHDLRVSRIALPEPYETLPE
jgi:hypothetical protein